MAERAFETPYHFLQFVAQPNLEAFFHNPASLQAAFNAIMSCDAFAGHIFYFAKNAGSTAAENDSAFRAELAELDESFRIVRDTAKALKHIALDRHNPVISRADQTGMGRRGYGIGLWGIGGFGDDEVMIQLENGDARHCLSEVVVATRFLSCRLVEIGP